MQLVCDQSDELTIGGFSLGIGNRVPKEPLKGIQIASVPSYLDGMADGSFHSAGGGLEGFCNLGIQNLGDGIDGVPTAHLTATAATVFVDDL